MFFLSEWLRSQCTSIAGAIKLCVLILSLVIYYRSSPQPFRNFGSVLILLITLCWQNIPALVDVVRILSPPDQCT